MSIQVEQLKQDCRGKWVGIFDGLGIETPHPPGNHGSCPICKGGKDRFRLDKDSDETGCWFCNRCSPMAGDGIALVQMALGLTFPETIARVAEIVGTVDVSTKDDTPKQDPRKRLNELWESSVLLDGSDLVTQYLRSRKLVLTPQHVRFCPRCWEPETKKEMPAMISRVTLPDGKPVTLHRTYLDGPAKAKIESPKKLMPGTQKLTGAAIRLFHCNELLGVAEGIETAIAASQIFGVPVWATVSSTLMESFVPPAGVRKVIVFADNDPNFVGQKAAYRLANRLYSNDLIVDVEIPSTKDFNDEL